MILVSKRNSFGKWNFNPPSGFMEVEQSRLKITLAQSNPKWKYDGRITDEWRKLLKYINRGLEKLI